jgi:integrase
MLVKPLSNTEVKNAKATGKAYALHDGFGLLLHVSKIGGKVWRLRYQHPDTKKRQTLTIGSYPEFTLAEAREARDKAKKFLSRGIDPNAERRAIKAERIKRNGEKFKSIMNSWFKVKFSDCTRKNTLKLVKSMMENYIIPAIGDTSIHDITAVSAIKAFQSYSDRPASMLKAISLTNNIFDFAVNTGVISSNPIKTIYKAFPANKTTPQKALDINRLPDLLNQWDTAKTYQSSKRALIFLILTMTRPSEALGAMWSEIDEKNRLWIIPPERMKSGREHTVPLSSQAWSVIEEMKSIRKSDYIFYGFHSQKKPTSDTTIRNALSACGFHQEMTLHGFRAMWSSLLNEEGFNPDVIEAALAHKSGDVVRNIYNRTTYLEQRKVMMQWVGDFVESAKCGIISRANGKRGLKIVNE